jgi:hypothetical protein
MNKTKTQTKQPVNKEAFKMLASEVGLNEAARRLGVPIPTAKSWARRGGWKLLRRKGGRPQRTIVASSMHPVADALDATHNELADATKTAILLTISKAAQLAARKPALDVSTVAELRDLASALGRLCDNGKPQTSVAVNATVQTGIVCDEATRRRLIELRKQIGAPVPQNAIEPHKEKVQAATPPPMLPAPTSLPIPPPDDGIPKWVKDIGTAESWKHGKGE